MVFANGWDQLGRSVNSIKMGFQRLNKATNSAGLQVSGEKSKITLAKGLTGKQALGHEYVLLVIYSKWLEILNI